VSALDTETREWFDEQVEQVIDELPRRVRTLLEEVALIVEDCPSPKMLELLELPTDEGVAGLHSGQMLTERSVEDLPRLPTQVYLFRLGVLDLVENLQNPEEIREQIRITILHELGHHVGLKEDDLDSLGYA
jgi:predicted Zn-dependent protease with MMP-like domain